MEADGAGSVWRSALLATGHSLQPWRPPPLLLSALTRSQLRLFPHIPAPHFLPAPSQPAHGHQRSPSLFTSAPPAKRLSFGMQRARLPCSPWHLWSLTPRNQILCNYLFTSLVKKSISFLRQPFLPLSLPPLGLLSGPLQLDPCYFPPPDTAPLVPPLVPEVTTQAVGTPLERSECIHGAASCVVPIALAASASARRKYFCCNEPQDWGCKR